MYTTIQNFGVSKIIIITTSIILIFFLFSKDALNWHFYTVTRKFYKKM